MYAVVGNLIVSIIVAIILEVHTLLSRVLSL